MAESQYVLGKDIDLDKEVIRDSTGKRITSKRAQKIVEEVLAQAVGRPSLTGPSKVSPEIKARVPEKLKRALQKEAKRQGQTTSAVIRQALEEYLDTAWSWWGGSGSNRRPTDYENDWDEYLYVTLGIYVLLRLRIDTCIRPCK